MKALEMETHFFSKAPWINRDRTVDGILVGDPEKEIQKVLVTWMPSFDAIKKAVADGYDMLLVHEPTFFAHKEREDMLVKEVGRQKKEFIEAKGLVLMRNHDCWDRFPDIGIPWAWGSFLGFGDKPAAQGGNNFLHRYDIDPITVDGLAKHVAEKTSAIGEPAVQVIGDGSRVVSKVGSGTGCACNTETYMDMGCEVSIVCDDGSIYWRTIQLAKDSDHPVIRVNHGTSEEPGMVTMTQYVNDTFGGVSADHLPHGCCFRLVGAGN